MTAAGFYQFGTTQAVHRLTKQTFFLEPLESAVLFAAPRVVAIQGDLPFVRVDGEGSVQSRRRDFERVMYKAISDTNEPRMDELRNDTRHPYPLLFIVTCNCLTISILVSIRSRLPSFSTPTRAIVTMPRKRSNRICSKDYRLLTGNESQAGPIRSLIFFSTSRPGIANTSQLPWQFC